MRTYDYPQDEMEASLAQHGFDVRIAGTVIIKRPELFRCGSHVAIDDYCVFTTQVEMGDYIHIPPFVSVIGGAGTKLTLGHFAVLTAGVRLVCGSDEFKGAGLVSPLIPDEFRDNVLTGGVTLEPFASVCSNSVVSPGVVLRQGAVVGANSFVPANTVIPAWEIWAGSPARFIAMRQSAKMLVAAYQMGYDLYDYPELEGKP